MHEARGLAGGRHVGLLPGTRVLGEEKVTSIHYVLSGVGGHQHTLCFISYHQCRQVHVTKPTLSEPNGLRFTRSLARACTRLQPATPVCGSGAHRVGVC